jgi:hypothetical protein
MVPAYRDGAQFTQFLTKSIFRAAALMLLGRPLLK